MSYKFQRLREKIRKAIETGELTGKLPGERALARRFHVNAKTLSKALTDLAAEGVLDRSIGRGTYVKGSAPAPSAFEGRMLVLCDAQQQNTCIVENLRRLWPELETAPATESMRPSFLNQFTAVLNLTPSTPEPLLRDLLVRNLSVVAVNHEPKAYSMHAVVVDVPLGVSRLGRDLLLAGHRKIGAIETAGSSLVAQTLRQTADRYSTEAEIHSAAASEAHTLVNHGATALVCASTEEAQATRDVLSRHNVDVPARVSITAAGCMCPEAACSGYFVQCDKIAEAAIGLLKDSSARPVTLWLPGTWVDRGTLAAIGTGLPLEQTAPLRVSGVVV
ncbi:MAG TPA: GntR family transcriptional regulator [Tepidisphaeraceae bacterium]|nr:GntR family transcriptional regulator [Tepidisphaeraceae bacterium]